MSVLLMSHESSFKHLTPPGHPERADRLDAVLRGVHAASTPVTEMVAPAIDGELLRAIHSNDYVAEVERFCRAGGGGLDPDTFVVPESFEAALHAAGAGPAAVDALRGGSLDAAFVAVRPPGHHAERSGAMGFCLFNNIAVTAAYLRIQGERVAIVDWDVHHGNGTQNTFYDEPDVLYVSIHESPFYPGTGWIEDQGSGRGLGTTVNVPLPGGTSADSYRVAFGRIVVPVVEQFDPDWMLISNGYDAHMADPLGGMMLESVDYGEMAGWAVGLVPKGRVVALLEGGYDLDALTDASRETVDGLGGELTSVSWPTTAAGAAAEAIDRATEGLARHWELR